MWDGWNPIQDIKDEWTKTRCIWGKIKVIVFYFFVWWTILGYYYMFLVPTIIGWDCLVQDEESVGIRLFSLYLASFSLYVVRDGTKLPNLRFFVGVCCLVYGTLYWFRDAIEPDCFETVTHDVPQDLSFWIVLMICAYVERRVDGRNEGTTEETTSLVT